MERLRFYTTERLSLNRFETPEGYLLVRDVPLARTGVQVYGPGEVPVEAGPDGRILIDREPEEVFRPETLASFNLKPLVDDHPPVDIDPSNWRDLTVGVIHDPRRGEGIQDDLMLGDVLITCPKMIAAVKSGERREVSAGYDADYEQTDPGRGFQKNIIGNHVAFVERGRCGERCAVGDRVVQIQMTLDSQKITDLIRQQGAAVTADLVRYKRKTRHLHIHL